MGNYWYGQDFSQKNSGDETHAEEQLDVNVNVNVNVKLKNPDDMELLRKQKL